MHVYFSELYASLGRLKSCLEMSKCTNKVLLPHNMNPPQNNNHSMMLCGTIITLYVVFSPIITAESSDRFFSAALGSIDRDYRVAFMNVSLSDTSDPDTLQTSELFRTPINDRWLKCECVAHLLSNYGYVVMTRRNNL